jgi:hypothetical protein
MVVNIFILFTFIRLILNEYSDIDVVLSVCCGGSEKQ